jgi:hypothetical protein
LKLRSSIVRQPADDYGSEGLGFESLRSHQKKKAVHHNTSDWALVKTPIMMAGLLIQHSHLSPTLFSPYNAVLRPTKPLVSSSARIKKTFLS